jgi:hypothetical protein
MSLRTRISPLTQPSRPGVRSRLQSIKSPNHERTGWPRPHGTMYCRWHGLALTQTGDQTWSPNRAYDDGVLIWAGLPTDVEVATDRPSLPTAHHCPNR